MARAPFSRRGQARKDGRLGGTVARGGLDRELGEIRRGEFGRGFREIVIPEDPAFFEDFGNFELAVVGTVLRIADADHRMDGRIMEHYFLNLKFGVTVEGNVAIEDVVVVQIADLERPVGGGRVEVPIKIITGAKIFRLRMRSPQLNSRSGVCNSFLDSITI